MNAKIGFILPLLALVVGGAVLAEEPSDYRFPRECTMTPNGYPVPLCGKPLTKTPVVIKKEGAVLKKYPEHFVPEQEELASNEMRITAVGSGNPPVRRGQASTSWLVELGNGDKFIFDIGSGSAERISSLQIPYDYLDKIFIGHLHADHIGSLADLFIGGALMGRQRPLRIWGPSSSAPELGTA